MKIVPLLAVSVVSLSCKPSYSYEGQQRAGDPYQVEWITDDGKVATCFVIESASSTFTASSDGIVINAVRFAPDGDNLVISDVAGGVKESARIDEFIYFCSSGGYEKINRSEKISDLIRDDYRDMDHELIDYLISNKLIP